MTYKDSFSLCCRKVESVSRGGKPEIPLYQPFIGNLLSDQYERLGGDYRMDWFAVNDLDNAISEIDYNDHMTFFDIEKLMGKVISKELECNSLKQE